MIFKKPRFIYKILKEYDIQSIQSYPNYHSKYNLDIIFINGTNVKIVDRGKGIYSLHRYIKEYGWYNVCFFNKADKDLFALNLSYIVKPT